MTSLGKALALGAALAGVLAGCGGQSKDDRAKGTNGGSTASGGSAGTAAANTSGGTGAIGAGAGGGSTGGVPGVPPPPVPLGAFGEVIDRFIRARTNAIQSLCCTGFCCDDPDELADPISCLGEEYFVFLPATGWLACASRVAAMNAEVSDYFSMQATCFESCAARNWTLECGSLDAADSCNACAVPAPAALGGCGATNTFSMCPSGPLVEGASSGRICNGTKECLSGIDELNCDPTATSYQCTPGESVPWLSLCDGVADCSNAADEFSCDPPPV